MKDKILQSAHWLFDARLARPLHGMVSVMAIAAMLAPGHSAAAAEPSGVSADSNDPMVLIDTETLTVRSHLQFGLNAVAENNLFWNLAESAAGNTEFNADARWLEAYVLPGLSFNRNLQSGASVFGKLSAVASYTAGTDAFDAGNTGRMTLEESYIGYRTATAADWKFEATLGPRPLRLGTGMLIANGGADGFERGALKFGPRKAWEMAGIMQLSRGGTKATAFYLDANELSSSDSNNRLGGIDLRWDGERAEYAGFTYIRVIESEAPYPKAAPGGIGPPSILPAARDGLNTVNVYGRSARLVNLSNLSLALDIAYQWNPDIDLRAWGGRFKSEYAFTELPWTPSLAYTYQIFSGDDPNTDRLERFDPLYYDGAPSMWATGSKSAMVFINSNVQSHGLSLRLKPTALDAVTLRYAHVRVDQLRSPVQFGQATRLDFSDGISTVVSGVTDAHLSDDFFVEYNRIVNPNTFLNAGISTSIPGRGIKKVAGGDAPNWTGVFFNIVFNY